MIQTPALRIACTTLLLSFWTACLLLLATLGYPGAWGLPLLFYGLPLFAGLAGAFAVRRIVLSLQWRELCVALPFVPLLTALFIASAKLVFHLKNRDMNGVADLGLVYAAWGGMGAFLLPLVDNDLREAEPVLALRRPLVAGLALAAMAALGLLFAMSGPAWQRQQFGYGALVFVGLPALLVTGFGWIMGVSGIERSGAYATCAGTLALFAAVALWAVTGGYSPG